MSVSSEKLYMNEEEAQQFQEQVDASRARVEERNSKKGTGAKIVKKTVGTLLLAGTIGVTGITGYIHGTRAINANKVISAYQSEYESQYVCVADEVLSNKSYDFKVCSGSTFTKYLEKKGIEYIKLNGEYYTADGREITIYTLKVSGTKTVSPTCMKDGVNTFYAAPSGYILEGTKAVKKVSETITYVANPNMDLSDGVTITLSDGTLAEKIEVLSEETVSTKKYETMESCDLICDVPDNCVENETETYPAKLTLRK